MFLKFARPSHCDQVCEKSVLMGEGTGKVRGDWMGGEVDREEGVWVSVCVFQCVCVSVCVCGRGGGGWGGGGGESAKAFHSHNRNYLHNGRLR